MILFYRWHVLRIYLIWCATVDHLNSDRILVGLLRLVVPFPSGRSISIPSFHFQPLVRFPTLFLFFNSVLALSTLLGSGVSAAAPANHADCAALVPLAEVRIEPPDALPKGKAAVMHAGTCVPSLLYCSPEATLGRFRVCCYDTRRRKRWGVGHGMHAWQTVRRAWFGGFVPSLVACFC